MLFLTNITYIYKMLFLTNITYIYKMLFLTNITYIYKTLFLTNITYIYKAPFLTWAHSALQLLTTFLITKYTSVTDALSQADISCSSLSLSHTHVDTNLYQVGKGRALSAELKEEAESVTERIWFLSEVCSRVRERCYSKNVCRTT